ncbi:MAG: molybdopterin-guanine dinucleotide biosynthesis protein MobB, partial [Planctomycetota bacterium]|nr:molybdopterin-guanine dinucleotide biosynthesis protein MobB [Planctomycetota bacterium]
MLRDLPIFGICGRSGSGKTTLIEQLLLALLAEGLS